MSCGLSHKAPRFLLILVKTSAFPDGRGSQLPLSLPLVVSCALPAPKVPVTNIPKGKINHIILLLITPSMAAHGPQDGEVPRYKGLQDIRPSVPAAPRPHAAGGHPHMSMQCSFVTG